MQEQYPDGRSGVSIEESTMGPVVVPPNPGELQAEAKRLMDEFRAARESEAAIGKVGQCLPLPLCALGTTCVVSCKLRRADDGAATGEGVECSGGERGATRGANLGCWHC